MGSAVNVAVVELATDTSLEALSTVGSAGSAGNGATMQPSGGSLDFSGRIEAHLSESWGVPLAGL